MGRTPPFAGFRHRAAWLLAIGPFAIALNAIGGVGLRHACPVDGFRLEISGAAGKAHALPQPGRHAPSATLKEPA